MSEENNERNSNISVSRGSDSQGREIVQESKAQTETGINFVETITVRKEN